MDILFQIQDKWLEYFEHHPNKFLFSLIFFLLISYRSIVENKSEIFKVASVFSENKSFGAFAGQFSAHECIIKFFIYFIKIFILNHLYNYDIQYHANKLRLRIFFTFF